MLHGEPRLMYGLCLQRKGLTKRMLRNEYMTPNNDRINENKQYLYVYSRTENTTVTQNTKSNVYGHTEHKV